MNPPGIGDVIAVTTLAIQVYKIIHDRPQGYKHLLDDLSTTRVILEQLNNLKATLTID